ncbi:hypothetical protein M0812_07043 [Anaeramoeba flamelloides]|uniref:Uncharacterized protein n=1 Tax=Anaeramoeba flamelloides TaxID=1746091 RepID=A0AAV8A9P0_9EUKA|nr:hypothetical protein M0812_07043 [Anaeramoeba flamelloides]
MKIEPKSQPIKKIEQQEPPKKKEEKIIQPPKKQEQSNKNKNEKEKEKKKKNVNEKEKEITIINIKKQLEQNNEIKLNGPNVSIGCSSVKVVINNGNFEWIQQLPKGIKKSILKHKIQQKKEEFNEKSLTIVLDSKTGILNSIMKGEKKVPYRVEFK